MPTAQGRSATPRPFYVLFDAAGRSAFLKLRRSLWKRITTIIFCKQTSSSINKMIFIHLLDFSAAHRKFRLSCTRCSSLSVRINGEEDNPSLKKHSHSMGRCHVFWFSFFVFTIDHPSLSISSFLKFVLVTHLCLERPSRHDGFSSNLEVDYRKWQSCRNESLSNGFCLLPHFMESTVHVSLWFTIVISSHILSVRLSILASSKEVQLINLQFILKPVLVYLIYTFRWFLPCYFMAFCSDLASFPQSK